MRLQTVVLALVILGLSILSAPAQGIGAGRYMKTENPFSISFHAGLLTFDKGEVRETRRAYDPDQSGVPDYSAFLSAYTLEDLGFDGSYPTLGGKIEKQWSFFTFQLDLLYANPTADAVAKMKKTASPVPADKKGYYIGVDEAIYRGKNYEYMWIPDGTKFDSDIETMVAEARLKFTPFHLGGGGVHLSPWVHAGIYGGYASYEIDAGPATGLVTYEVPPKTYVVKGQGTGDGGLAIPELGAGGELRFDFGDASNHPASLVLSGDFSWMHYSGSPNNIGFNIQSTRNVDFDFFTVNLEVMFEIPLNESLDLLAGVTYRSVRADASLDSVHRTESAQRYLNEKYDKRAEFAFTQLMGNIGLRF